MMTRFPRIHFLCLLAAFQLLNIVTARPASPSESEQPSSTTSSAIQTHTIQVGSGDHKFKPDFVQAEVGDIVQFDFFPTNHSVVRAEYTYPCIPYEMSGENKTGFFSGFHHVKEISSNPPKYTIRINDTDPIFFYCSAPSSCTKFGMVGAINPNYTTSIITQRQMALNAAYQLSPGEPFPAEGSPTAEPIPTDGPDPTDTHPPASTSTSPPATSAPPIPPTPSLSLSSHPHPSTLKPGAIAGIVIGAVAVLTLAGALFFYIGRTKTLKAEVVRKVSTIRHPSDPPSPSPAMMYTGGTGGGPNTGGAVPRAYFSPKPASELERNEVRSPWASPRSVDGHGLPGHRSPDPVYQTQIQHSVARSASQSTGGVFGIGERGAYVREEETEGENKTWEKEAPVPLGPYGKQMYEKHINPHAPSEMDGRGSGQRI